MRIEMIDNTLCIDKKKIASDVMINVVGNSARIKMNCIVDNTSTPVDFNIYNFTTPQMKRCSLCSTINGYELITNSNFNLSISFNAINMDEIKIVGNVNGIKVDERVESLASIPNQISSIINKTLKK